MSLALLQPWGRFASFFTLGQGHFLSGVDWRMEAAEGGSSHEVREIPGSFTGGKGDKKTKQNKIKSLRMQDKPCSSSSALWEEPSAVRQRALVVTRKAHLAAIRQWVEGSEQVLLLARTSKAVPLRSVSLITHLFRVFVCLSNAVT